MVSQGYTTQNLNNLIELSRYARHAETAQALQFILVNQTVSLAPYLIAVLWVEDEGILLQSGVSHVEKNAPFVMWVGDLCSQLIYQDKACIVQPDMLSNDVVEEWKQALPEQAVWFPFSSTEHRAGLLLARTQPFTDADMRLLTEWVDIWAHAWSTLNAPSVHGELKRFWLKLIAHLPDRAEVKAESWAVLRGGQQVVTAVRQNPKTLISYMRDLLTGFKQRLFHARNSLKQAGFDGARLYLIDELKQIWNTKRRRYKWLFWIVILFPVRLSVLAPGELVPANPAIIRVPIDGVISEFFVAPNDRVVAGQPLLSLDLTSLLSKLQVAQQEIQIASQEYRQSALQSLTDSRSRGLLAGQEGKAAERKIESDYLQSLLDKAKIDAPRDGIVIFDDPSEWIGKPVVAGEKVMVVATEGNVEIEAWLPVGDALEVPKDSPVTLYLNAAPFSPVSGKLRYMAHEPVQRPDGTYAYRIRATVLPASLGPRVGLKGTARVSGQFVPFVYWVFRKPLASLRQMIGF